MVAQRTHVQQFKQAARRRFDVNLTQGNNRHFVLVNSQ